MGGIRPRIRKINYRLTYAKNNKEAIAHMINIVIADDHQLVREGIKRIFDEQEDVRCVGETDNIADLLVLLGQTMVDVLLLDFSLGGLEEMNAIAVVQRHYPRLPVLVVSMYEENPYAILALRNGASGYVCKTMAAESVVMAVRKVATGGRYVSGSLAELLAEGLGMPRQAMPHERLTDRERQVMRCLGAGQSSKQVAANLGISISSVHTYRGRIFTKMDLQNNADLIRYAVVHRL
jgi:two-component system invasion response regulator UvrY